MSKIELPPLPEHAAAWVIPGDDGGSLKEWVDAKPFSDGEFTAPLFAASQLRARDRQIVELCASLADALSYEVELIPPSNKFARGRMQGMWDCAAAIRSLLDPAEKETK